MSNSHSYLPIWAYGTHLLKLHGGHLTFALQLCGFRYTQSHKGSWLPFPGRGLGRHWAAPSGYGVHFNSAKPGHQVQVGLQPNSCVDASLPGPPTHSGKGSQKADTAGWWRYQLAICLYQNEWCHGPHTFVQWGAHWHHDWWLSSRNACGHLHQLQVWQLLQCRGQAVCLDGLNGSLEPLLCDFKELPLWSMANIDEPTQDPIMIDVDLSNVVPEVPPPPEQKIHSACISEEHWSRYSGLPQPPPTLPYNTSLPGHNCHQWPWELLPQMGKQKILLGLWEQSPISLPWQ